MEYILHYTLYLPWIIQWTLLKQEFILRFDADICISTVQMIYTSQNPEISSIHPLIAPWCTPIDHRRFISGQVLGLVHGEEGGAGGELCGEGARLIIRLFFGFVSVFLKINLPIVANSVGGWHNEALNQFRKLGSALSRNTGTEESVCIGQVRDVFRKKTI